MTNPEGLVSVLTLPPCRVHVCVCVHMQVCVVVFALSLLSCLCVSKYMETWFICQQGHLFSLVYFQLPYICIHVLIFSTDLAFEEPHHRPSA